MIDYVERVGFDYKPWKPSDVFQPPGLDRQNFGGK